MNKLSELLSIDRIITNCNLQSKKRALELLSKLLTEELTSLNYQTVLNAILEREKLGSTVMGYGIALPHARFKEIDQPVAAVIKLFDKIVYDSQEEPVKLLVGLILPENDKQLCLDCLGQIASQLRDEQIREQLFETDDPEVIYQLLIAD